ncbi:MAG: FG-GAP repeat protein, partial [Phycisphaerae bacterium]
MSLSKTANTSYVGVALAMFACGANMVQAQCERQKVLSTDGSTGDDFGTSVSVSGDYAIVGAPQADGDTFGTNNAGAAYILKRTGATWSQWGPQITASDRADNDAFGGAVAISGDFAVVGAEFDDDAGLTSGSAYIFRRDADAWVQDVKLTADDAAAFDHFGASVAMADPYVVVGVPFDDEAADNSGSVYVFKRTGATWSFFQKVVNPAPGLGDHFGQAVAIAGGYMLIGVEQ